METLNEDCIREILKHLDLRNQIALLQLNRLFQQAVHSLWMVQYKHARIKFLEKNLTDEEYGQFFNVIKDFAAVLELRLMDKEKYEILKNYTFPRVRNLRLSIHPCFLTDEDVLDLHRMFPNLIAFSPNGNLTGRYLDLWPNLKELNLSYCYKLELQQFHHIMEVLTLEHLELNTFPLSKQCEQLELQRARVEQLRHLRLNTYEFYYFLTRPLPSLKHLIITNQYNPRQLFDVLLSTWPAKDIRKLETANVENVLANCLEMSMNVEEICIVSDRNVLPPNVIKSLSILTDLRVLRLKNCKLYTVNVMHLLKSIPQLDVLSLEDCRLEEHHIDLNVPEIVEKRTKVLRLNFYENQPRNLRNALSCECADETIVTVSLLGAHNLFQLSKNPGSDLSFEPLYVHFR